MSKSMTFADIFREGMKVTIPRLQRNYVQGRASEEILRETFVNNLLNHLKPDSPPLLLDFIYGKNTDLGSGGAEFIPLDGQQRLTTLFLLHWYLACAEEGQEEFLNLFADRSQPGICESKFIYKTRPSATEFCHFLVKHCPDFELPYPNEAPRQEKQASGLLQNYADFCTSGTDSVTGNGRISALLRSYADFYSSWEYDPTVKGMLTMLDSIHFACPGNLLGGGAFQRLTAAAGDQRPISFFFLDLAALIGNPDTNQEQAYNKENELYITMNSRGLPLTPFENFKAELTLLLRELEMDDDFCREFSRKLDTDWSNLFWHYRTKKDVNQKPVNNYDKEFLFFIRTFITNYYAGLVDSNNDDGLIYLQNRSEKLTFAKMRKLNIVPDSQPIGHEDNQDACDSNEGLKETMRKMLSHLAGTLSLLYQQGTAGIRTFQTSSTSRGYDEENIFDTVIHLRYENNNDTLTYLCQLRFYAFYSYLVRFGTDDEEKLRDWMRVILNLTENTDYNRGLDYCNSIRGIDQLLPEANRILDFLREASDLTGFLKEQLVEEKIKAILFRDGSWQDEILKAERHSYFSGQIGFLLNFSGIRAAYDLDPALRWTEDESKTYLGSFGKYHQCAAAFFDENGVRETGDNLSIRALLCGGLYYLKRGQNFTFLNNGKHRDRSWRRLLRYFAGGDQEQKEQHNRAQEILKALFVNPAFDPSNLKESLETIANGYVSASPENDLRHGLIHHPEMLAYIQQREIQFGDGDDPPVYLLSRQRIDSFHREYHSWLFYLENPGLGFKLRDSCLSGDEPDITFSVGAENWSIYYSGKGFYTLSNESGETSDYSQADLQQRIRLLCVE